MKASTPALLQEMGQLHDFNHHLQARYSVVSWKSSLLYPLSQLVMVGMNEQ